MKILKNKFFIIYTIAFLIAISSSSGIKASAQNSSENILTETKNIEYLDAVLELIKTRFYDKNYCGIELKKLRKEYLPEVIEAQNQKELHRIVNNMIAQFKVSHFAVIEKEIYLGIENEHTNNFLPEFGFKMQKIDNQFFATRFSEDGAAKKSKLMLGDEILEVNNEKVSESEKLLDSGNDVGIPSPEYYILKANKDEKIILKIKRNTNADPITIEITAQQQNEIKSIENSISVIEKDGKKFAYIHTWHFLTSKVAQLFYDAIKNKFQDCDALILDIRGHGGNSMVIQMMLAPFNNSRFTRAPRWTKPLVVLIDEGTRSAKEIFAYVIKRDKLGTLVGRKTQGAVLATTFFELPDKSVLMLPVMDAVNIIKGNPKLEGVGVKPVVEVEFALKYANGVDEILEAGINQALKLTAKEEKNSPVLPNNDNEDEIIEDF